MTYELGFLNSALKEWRKLDTQTRDQFKKKLAERLDHPHVPASKLSGAKNRYKIKLRNIGYRLVYEVHDTEVIVIVVAVGRRDRNAVYKAAEKHTNNAATVTTMAEARQMSDNIDTSEHQSLTGEGRTLLDAVSGRDNGDLDFEPSKLGNISRPADLD